MPLTDKQLYRVIDDVNSYYRITSESKKELLLNKYPNAAAAYSLRLLDGYYRGPLVRVRRTDGVEVDVYPDYNNELSLDSLVTNVAVHTTIDGIPDTDYEFQQSLSSLGEFVGATGYSSTIEATDATVCVWYDQSSTDGVPNANDAKQVVATNQPLIVSSGVIVEENGKPAALFNDIAYLRIGVAFPEPFTMASVHVNSIDQGQTEYVMGAIDKPSFAYTSGRPFLIGNASYLGTTLTSSQQRLRLDRYSSVLNVVNINIDGSVNSNHTGVTTYTASAASSLGSYWTNGGSPLVNTMQEFVFWSSYQDDSNKTDIEEDINSFYQIDGYTPTPKLIDLTQGLAVQNGGTIADGTPAAAYSLRTLSSTYTRPLVRVRRSTDNVEVDVYADSEGSFSLLSPITDGGNEQSSPFSGSSSAGSTSKTKLYEFVYGQGCDLTVVTWYDQASSNNATQTTTGNQPKIYDSSTGVVTENAKPALSFDGDDDRFPFDSTPLDIASLSSFLVSKMSTTAGVHRPLTLSGPGGNNRWYAPQVGGGTFAFNYGNGILTTVANTNNNLHTMIAGSTQGNAEAFINGTSLGTMTLDSGIDPVTTGIGGIAATSMTGYIQEVIVYASDQSANRTNIEDNINQHYNIY